MARYIKIDRIDAEEQLLVRLAWACEIEGLTQSEAAERFGVTRVRVNKALAEARKRGILRVNVESIYAAAAELEWTLEHRFRLHRVCVVPSPEDASAVTPLVGAGLGALLSTVLADPGITTFGMSWGNTLNLATRHIQPINRPDLEIVSVMGGISRGSDVNGYEITTRLADLCNAAHSFFIAPLYAGSRSSRDLFMEQDVITEQLDRVRSCEALALATGDLESSLLVRDALPRDVDRNDLLRLGGVGDIMGYVLNAEGALIDHPLNARVVGMTLDDLKRIPNVILAAGGAHKVPIMRAALQRGLIDTLVTDENTARGLLAEGDV